MKYLFVLFFTIALNNVYAQKTLFIKVFHHQQLLKNAQLQDLKGNVEIEDSINFFTITYQPTDTLQLNVSALGYLSKNLTLYTDSLFKDTIKIQLIADNKSLQEVVVTGTQKPVSRLESLVPVEVYSSSYFYKNPTPNLFEALQYVNGVRPQINCNICNTGDIHINGLDGPYTSVLIDGMPIVSSLSTVYGLSGIPNSMIERVEIVKGPASSLYGSEAVGGLINIITKQYNNVPKISFDVFTTSYLENNIDAGIKFKAFKSADVLTGINYFNYKNKVDYNNDNFTDVAIQDRISIFQKWALKRKSNRILTLAGRYYYEDRWGGEMQWTKANRGGNQIYGESIFTERYEFIGNYQLPVKEKMFLSFSLNQHHQDSRYGLVSYIAKQNVAFGQLTFDKKFKSNDFLAGLAMRYTFYDDNTVATKTQFNFVETNAPERTFLPGIFVQNEFKIDASHTVLGGLRYDYNFNHGHIFTPRLAYKYKINEKNSLRLNAGTGFRIVNIFTEDHAALTGARNVIISESINPEKSYNVNINYLGKLYSKAGNSFTFDVSGFYTYFNNRIIADFDSHPNEIRYQNLDGFAVSKGVTINFDASFIHQLKCIVGATFQDISIHHNNIKSQQILTEKFSGTWAISYKIKSLNIDVDYTGNVYGPMRLPLIGENDMRKPYSPIWSLQNIQLLFSGFKRFELYGGIKNILNFTPNKGNPYIIAGADEPFSDNFDPSYIYAPNQKLRTFVGVRMKLN